ncbi:homoserine dehydrogenase [Candidatus Saganbacteria bacterium CG08_land_8_20_14_0_20_45_16]|uniref:Homoserine dehydrogenase n=1 Tax=Candidatus Saganbacteria bacterium CG08_land_8_20_14_0_20_45_16 TaxID=2014293 RepID=A0A2H0Y1R5_UNCSA|nr:MAG: homoserine dehydrogenase [Candidatus Saganbacteria bacterium CG08_land_8_20_14_0_20_45_16]
MKKVYVGIIGFGNIGSAVAEFIKKNHQVIAANTGLDLELKKVCDTRQLKIAYPLTHQYTDIINDPEIAVVVEAIGGTVPAKKIILAALNQKKHVVTPNKEVVAKHMKELLAAAAKNKVQLLFEASVGGGIPIIQPIKESLAGNNISQIYGIVNGTTNYILFKMSSEKMEFASALKQAQDKGYAEPNPKADIEGYDAAYKAAILASVAFKAEVNWQAVYREGITGITQEDIQYAKDIGYVVKLLAIAQKVDEKIDIRVHPALLPANHALATVADNYNAIYVKGTPVGPLMFYGQGAGGGPTASAIISDIIASANSKFEIRNSTLKKAKVRNINEVKGKFYIRLEVPDRVGVLAGISKVFAQKKVSIAAVLQKESNGQFVTLIILTDKVVEKNLRAALATMKKLSVVHKIGSVIRLIA